MMLFSTEELEFLYNKVKESMSDYRFEHTAGVERAAIALGELYMPNRIDELRAAALLHDITKELSVEEHIEFAKRNGRVLSEDELRSPKTLHAITAEYAVRERFSSFASEGVCQAVRFHTTGNENMSVFDAIIYLADYIEDTRTFEDCVYLRNYFWSAEPSKMEIAAREEHLWKTVLLSLDMTVSDLEKNQKYISEATLLARSALAKRFS